MNELAPKGENLYLDAGMGEGLAGRLPSPAGGPTRINKDEDGLVHFIRSGIYSGFLEG